MSDSIRDDSKQDRDVFTPGPWRLKTTGNFGNAIEAFRGVVGEYDDGWRVVAMYQHCEPTGLWAAEQENAAANARLIAAAPELLAALERLHDDTADYIHINNIGDPYQNQNMRDARAAIAKARGQ